MQFWPVRSTNRSKMVHVLMQIEHILGRNAADDAKMKIFALRQHSGVCDVETRTVVRHCNVKILCHYTKKDVINMNQFQLKKNVKKTKKLDLKLCGMRGNEIRWHERIRGGGVGEVWDLDLHLENKKPLSPWIRL